MAHGAMEEWTDRDSCGSDKSPGPAQQGGQAGAGQGRVMGSRRIFPPQFKLQVLDSYRQDPDCKGNQRATARKYGIHRRQIQKWLQMESHLRSIASGGGGGAGSASSGGGSSMGSPAPSPSPTLEHHGAHAAHAAHALSAALNLSGVVRAAAGRPGSAASPASGSGCSPLHVPSPAGSPGCGAHPAAAAAGAGPMAPLLAQPLGALGLIHQALGHQVHHGDALPLAVPVPRLSVSPTLPIKKRWCQSPEQSPGAAASTPPPLPLASDEDDDDEDIDVDGDGSESEASSALDYTTATLSKRRSFSLQFKLAVLDAFRETPHCQGNQRATARAFGINRRQVQKWLGQEPELREEAVSRGGLNRQRLGRWLEQDDHPEDQGAGLGAGQGCLDLSRKRKLDAASDLDDAETEAKRSRTRPARETSSPASPSSPAAVASPTSCPRPLAMTEMHPSLPPHPLLFRPQPLPLMPSLPLPIPHLPFNLCAKQYSVDLSLKLSTLEYFNAYQQNLQKCFKPEDFLKPANSPSFLLNSFR
ncbi:HEAT repeat-containing protein 1-like protein [Frankliniella fusca]|uniref:HEAT repeat-containing protein 1-like protein n=1 Tax=Frankliniella fusca TaxID=407009 RepID=A0AAE1HF92_9NEOP|nr:HEAT repeat-containing protein 1-like protein [Frankliniella fusca]